MELSKKAPSRRARKAEARANALPMNKGRTVAYYVSLVVLNVLLGLYALYAFGLVLQYNWEASVASVSVFEVVLMVILAFSPFLVTIILNRILHRVFRGRKRFPRGTVLLTLLIIVVVQFVTILLTLRLGAGDPSRGMGLVEYASFFKDLVS